MSYLPFEHRVEVSGLMNENVDGACAKMEAQSLFFIARRKLDNGQDNVYVSCKTFNNHVLLAEVGFRPGTGSATIVVKSQQPQYVPLLASSIEKVLKS